MTLAKPLVLIERRHGTVILMIVFSVSWLAALGEWSQALSALTEALAMAAAVYLVQAVILAKVIGWTVGVHHERLEKLEL